MIKHLRKALVFVIVFFFMMTTNASSTKALGQGLTPQALNLRNLYYKNFINDINILDDGTYEVQLQIDVQYNTPHRGIFFNIPEEYEMDMTIDNQEVYGKYYFPVSEISVSGDEYQVESSDGFKNIRIGNPDRYVTGLKSYTISYKVTTQDKRLEHFDLVYWDILSADVQVPIENLEFSIRYPKQIEQAPYLYSGPMGSKGNDYIDFNFDGTTLTGTNHKIIPNFTGVTVEHILPIDYFSYPVPPNFGLTGMLVMALGALMAYFAFLKFGKDDILTIVPNTRPMPGYSSAQIGYIYDNQANNRDIISLIIEWASKGYLRIIQDEENKNAIELEKLREIDTSYPDFEQQFFNNLFRTGDDVSISSLRNKFHNYLTKALTSLTLYFRHPKRRLKQASSTLMKVLFTILTPLLFSIYIVLRGYQFFLHLGFSFSFLIILIAAIFIFSFIFILIFSLIQHQSNSTKGVVAVFFLVAGVLLFLGFSSRLKLIGALDYYTIIAMGSFIIMLFAASFMDKRTAYGNEILGHVLGLKQFIEMAEKEELEMLVYDDPEYFYEVLPYAYVLGVSDIWSKQFENIAVPEPSWYQGPSYTNFNTYYFMRNLENTMASTTNTLSSVPVQTSGRGGGGWSSGGGGFGGGSSGGGFGGGSSGGW